jgi:hypothetical protein
MRHTTHLVVGRKDVDTAATAHVRGVHEGNWPGASRRRYRKSYEPEVAPVSRSTGINADEREPINPEMPRLSPP